MQRPTLAPLPPAASARNAWPWIEGHRALPGARVELPRPRISVVIPSLNQGVFIEAAIRSVLLQDYPNVELIVVDGGSADGTIEVIRKYERLLAQWTSEPDNGPASALNRGFGLASGEIFGFLNADDFLLPGCLSTVARAFEAHASADVVSGHGYMTPESGELRTPLFSDRWNLTRFKYNACILLQPATFFRGWRFRQVAGFKETTRTTWDMELWADMAMAGATFHTIDEFLAASRVHSGSISGCVHLRKQRRRDARTVRQKVKGRTEALLDRLCSAGHRVLKFSSHPRRTLTQRFFLHSTLGRWSL